MTDGTREFSPRIEGWAGVAWYLAIAGLIFATALLGIELTRSTGRVATIWISNGVLLCFVLSALEAKRPLHEVLAILGLGFAGNFAADIVSGDALPMALTFSLANIIEVGICAAILARTGLALDFTRPRLLLVFCLVVFGPATVASGLIASTYLAMADGANFLDVFSTWYTADAIGLIIITPSLMVLRREDPRKLLQVSASTRLAGGIAIVAVTLFIVFGQSEFPLPFLVFPAILVATFWSGFTGASLAILMTAIVAGIATFNGSGPLQLIPGDHRGAIFVLQIFVAAAALQNLTVAAVLSERRRLGLESEERKGSTFWFTLTLPRTEAPSLDEVVPAAGDAVIPLQILLVEDLPMNQEVAETMLRRAGHSVDIAGDGHKAIEAAKASSYDLILMDIQMLGMDGVTAMKEIRKLGDWCADVPIIALTANVLPEQIARFIRAGFEHHLGKPFSRTELSAVVAKWGPKQGRRREPDTVETEDERAPGSREDLDQATFDQMRGLFGDDKLRTYLDTIHALLNDLKAGDADREALVASAHKLRSAAGMLGLMRISVLSGELEQACEAKEDVEALLAALREAKGAATECMTALRAA